MSVKKDLKLHLAAIKKNAIDLISEEELTLKLQSKKSLNLKIGFDPTARDIHLGHTVLLRKLRKLQDLGHTVCLVIGDFTAKIGDPSGKSTLRPILSDKEIKSNALTYTSQAFKILDKKKTKVIYNSAWFKKMDLSKFLSLLSSYTMARILERDDFSKRMKENKPLTMLEVVYPLVQGYDSVMLEADIEFGGTDQKFNLIVGRHLQENFKQLPQVVVTMPILVGLDGKEKMSKSLNNYVGVNDSSKDMFGKIMSISDEAMWEYFRLLTDHDLEKAKAMHPKEAKLLLAVTITSFYHCQKSAEKEREEFQRVFSQKELPKDILTVKASKEIDVISIIYQNKMASSKNEARRLLNQGAISIVAETPLTIKSQYLEVPKSGLILKIGKRKFLKIKPL
ncbi:MAG: tyrosine--tRNA ligase [Candidatus Omnitrophica bacterium]|nr:tyrosine--tRNA ligase [Candidatus Omnitrophota bacterium]